jgi:hypothetical protein
MASGIEITRPQLVLVEGKDDKHFCIALSERRLLPEVQFMEYGGKTNLSSFVHTLVRLPKFSDVRGLAVIRDADDNWTGAFQSITAALNRAGLPVPKSELAPATSGVITTVAFVLPGNGVTGELEDCLLQSVANHPYLAIVENFIKDVEQSKGAPLSERSKSKLRSFMAVQDPCHVLVGASAKAGIFPLDHLAFAGIEKLIRIICQQP